MSATISIPGFFEPFGSLLHLVTAGVVASLGTWLVRRGRGRGPRLAIAAFVIAATVLLALSGTYHLLDAGTPARAVLQRLDHAAIWTMIAASFTAIHGVAFRGPWRWGFLALVWGLAVPALVLELVFFSSFPEVAALSLYLALGWLGVVSAFALRQRYGWLGMRDLLAGGLAYSLGAVYDFASGPALIPGIIGPHEVFHVAVVLGVGLHWRFVAQLAVTEPRTAGTG
ncbi:MAG: hemolysin III family protein [Nannocystaceae bacterium]